MSADEKQQKRQLRIATGACKRLTVDLKMYVEEKNGLMQKLQALTDTNADKYAIKKQSELLEETCAVIVDTYGKVTEAYAKLDQMLCAAKANAGLVESEEVTKATQQLQKTFEILNPKKKQENEKKADTQAEAKSGQAFDKQKTVSIFGSGQAKPGDEEYKIAEEIGKALAKKGYSIMNGGYRGTMEAVSKGASSENGRVKGVLAPAVFPMRKGGNPYLTDTYEAKSIEKRLCTLVGEAGAFVVLPGSLGTLTELVMAWQTAVLSPLSGNKPPPIIAFRTPWEAILKGISAQLKVPQQMLELITFVSTTKETIEKLDQIL